MSPEALSHHIKQEAFSLGFSLAGVSGPSRRRDVEFHEWWVRQGFGAGMFFLRNQLPRRKSLEAILPGAQAALVCALPFPGGEELRPSEPAGKVARYAMHSDYHDRLLPLLKELGSRLDQAAGTEGSLAYVDTGPVNERALAASAGLGWIGKNGMLIHPKQGSWFWLGEIITRANLAPDSPMADHCGSCRRCLDACPTSAILEDLRTIDSRKCLSYWNIEHRGDIPQELHKPMGEWLLGCDICQEVCPWNHHSLKHGRAELGAPPAEWIPLEEILSATEADFKKRYGSRAVARAKFSGMQRNAKIVKGNLRFS